MTDLKLNSIAEGIFQYLREKTETPLDGISVLVITICILYRSVNDSMPFVDFAKSFYDSLIDTQRSVSNIDTERMQ